MNCQNCGYLIPENAESCPLCGASAKPPQENIFLPYSPEERGYKPATIPAPEAEPVIDEPAEPAPEVPPVPKKKKLLPLLLLCIPVLIAAVAAILLFSGKTVYLLTETVSTNNSTTSKIYYEYDNAGRIIEYRTELYYNSGNTSGYISTENVNADTDTGLALMSNSCLSYSYDKHGKILSVVIDNGYYTAKVEYVYEKGVITGFEVYGFSTYSKPVIEYNDRGLLTSIRFPYYYNSGETEYVYTWEFEYYDSGRISRSSMVTSSGNQTVKEYDETGNTIRAEFDNGGTTTTYIYDYDDRGNMILDESYLDGELSASIAIEYTYNGNRLESMVLTGMTVLSQGKGSYTFTCQYSGNEGILTVTERSGDESAMSVISYTMGYGSDPIIKFRLDNAGNLVYYETSNEGEVQSTVTNTYEKFRVSQDYDTPNVTGDPLYLYFLQDLT